MAGRKAKRMQGYEGGERARYFADDDAADLATLVKRQRHDGAPDLDANLADSILRKGAKFRWAALSRLVPLKRGRWEQEMLRKQAPQGCA